MELKITERLELLRVKTPTPRPTSRKARVRVVERVVAPILVRPVAEPGPGRVPVLRRPVRAEEQRRPVEQMVRLRAERRPSDAAAAGGG